MYIKLDQYKFGTSKIVFIFALQERSKRQTGKLKIFIIMPKA